MTESEAPRITSLLESSLYVAELDRAGEFYQRVLGLARVTGDERFMALETASGQLLLLFRRGSTESAATTPGGSIPGHGGTGELHLAFAIPAADLERWTDHLRRAGIAVESRVSWPRGGTSLYLRDPDGHLVELATPGLWPNY